MTHDNLHNLTLSTESIQQRQRQQKDGKTKHNAPVPVKATPISITVMDDTNGGKRVVMNLTGSSDRNTSKRQHTILVPSILFNAIGTMEKERNGKEPKHR